MTSPMMPQQPPVPPPSPFMPRANDQEPRIATLITKKFGVLMFEAEYAKQPPEWRALVDQKYQAAVKALTPPPVLPKGVNIAMQGDASTIGAEEQAAMHPDQQPPVAQQNGSGVMQPGHPTAPQMPSFHGPQPGMKGPSRPI